MTDTRDLQSSTFPSMKSPEVDPVAAQALALASNLLFRDYPAMPELLSEPLSPAGRSRLESRLNYLEYKLSPSTDKDSRRIAAAISGLLGAFPAASGGSVEGTVAKYVEILRDCPLWAILRACEAIETGRADGVSLDFRPAAPRVRQVVKTFLEPWAEELFNIRKVLTTPALKPEDAAMRDRLKGLFTKFAEDLKMGKYKTTEGAE